MTIVSKYQLSTDQPLRLRTYAQAFETGESVLALFAKLQLFRRTTELGISAASAE